MSEKQTKPEGGPFGDPEWHACSVEMLSAGATPDQGSAPLVGTGSWLSSGVESAKSLIAHWETRADYRRGRGWDDSAMAFQYCANQLRAAIGMPERRQPEDNIPVSHGSAAKNT